MERITSKPPSGEFTRDDTEGSSKWEVGSEFLSSMRSTHDVAREATRDTEPQTDRQRADAIDGARRGVLDFFNTQEDGDELAADDARELTAQSIDDTEDEHSGKDTLVGLHDTYKESYRHRLGDALSGMLTDLPEQHRELITADEVLRNKFAYAVRSLDAKDTLGIGQYIEAPEYEPKDARVAQHSEQLYEAGERVDSGFQATMQALALELGLSYQVGPVKKSSRIAEKAVVEEGLNGDSTQEKIENVVWQDVKDTVRGRFLVDDPRRIDELARGVQEAYEVLRTKSTLPTSRETGEVSLRGNKYMDTKFTLGVDDSQTGRRVKAEVAICTPEMAAATIAEHPVFEIIRSLDDRDARQVQLKAQLQKMSRDFFMAVSQQQADRLGEQ